jgi:hypothetical protein
MIKTKFLPINLLFSSSLFVWRIRPPSIDTLLNPWCLKWAEAFRSVFACAIHHQILSSLKSFSCSFIIGKLSQSFYIWRYGVFKGLTSLS